MKKNKAILFISIILVIALVMACAAGCQDGKKNGENYYVDGDKDVPTAKFDNADRTISFNVIGDAGSEDIAKMVTVVKTSTGEKINADVVKTKTGATVYPPSGFYEMGAVYKITIANSLRFEGYDSKIKAVVFTITKNSLSQISLVDGLLKFDATRVQNKQENFGTRGNSDQQEIFGSMVLQTNGEALKAGDIILISDEETKLQEAYKVDSYYPVSGTTAAAINYSKPQMNEVYDKFEVEESTSIDENSDIEVTYEDVVEVIEDSNLAQAAISFFGSKPEFAFDIKKVDGNAINAKITMTIPNVVAIDEFRTNLVITIDCTMKVDAIVNAKLDGSEVDCGVITSVYNNVKTEVAISSGYSYSDVTNLTELIEKLAAMEQATEEGVAIPMFTWVIPVANGAVSVRYQCDLCFSFNFSGKFGVKVDSDFNYRVGATYTKADGVETVAEQLEDSGVKDVTVEIEGSAKMKLGIANTLALDILAGVVSLGIKAELGNFNGLYGFATTGNLIDSSTGKFVDSADVTGAVYFEGGFYYDIDLLLALSIGSIANINLNLNLKKPIDIAQGEIVLYSLGQNDIVTEIEPIEHIELIAEKTLLPEFNAKGYNLKGSYEYDTTVSFADFEYDGFYLNIADGVVTVKNPNAAVDRDIDLVYKTQFGEIVVTTRFTYSGKVVLDKANFEYDKNDFENNKNDIEIRVKGSAIDGNEVVEVKADGAKYNTGLITIPYKALAAMPAGNNKVAIVVNGEEYFVVVNVIGKAGVFSFCNGGNSYDLFTAEQIEDLSELSQNGQVFSRMQFNLINDIDMNGAVIKPIGVFAGDLNGKGNTISNYVIEGVVDESVAFIAENRGRVFNLNLDGVVNAEIKASTGKIYNVAGAVAVNNGVVENVNVSGQINMKSTSLNAFVTINVMSLVASGSTASDSAANVVINAESQFDIANVTIYVDGSAAEYSVGCKNAAIKDGALVKFIIK